VVEPKVAATVFAVDSALEIKIGIGRHFDSKKKIGERETIVSNRNLEALQVKVGEDLTLHYDIKLILSMIQAFTGEVFPRFLTKETTLEQLQDDTTRSALAQELTTFIVDITPYDIDEDGYILVDFEA